MFNALKYSQELEKAGFTREQAETSVRLLIDIMNENFATKADLKETELRLESKLDSAVQRLEGSINEVRASVRELEYKMTIKLGAMMTLAIGVTATVVKLLQGVR